MNIDEYIRELDKIELLGREEETALWEKFKKKGDTFARRRIIESYQPLVFKVAAPYRQLSDVMDIIQEGTVGLIESAEAYDPDKGVAFSLFASCRIRGRMIDYLRKEGRADIACLDDDFHDMVPDVGLAVSEIVEMNEAIGKVMQAMGKLPEKERLVLDQVYIQSKEVKSVADDMNISASHVYRLQKSGVRRVRGILSKFMQYWK